MDGINKIKMLVISKDERSTCQITAYSHRSPSEGVLRKFHHLVLCLSFNTQYYYN